MGVTSDELLEIDTTEKRRQIHINNSNGSFTNNGIINNGTNINNGFIGDINNNNGIINTGNNVHNNYKGNKSDTDF